jgi:hypothetical protein
MFGEIFSCDKFFYIRSFVVLKKVNLHSKNYIDMYKISIIF